MNRVYYPLFIGTCILLLLACQSSWNSRINTNHPMQDSSGIQGKLIVLSGNQMPLQNKTKNSGKPLKTQVYIFNQLTESQLVEMSDQWCKQVNATPIKSQWSDSVGKYQIFLDPGKYSILVAYDGGYFIPFFNQYNEIASVDIVKGQFLQLDITVNRKAIY